MFAQITRRLSLTAAIVALPVVSGAQGVNASAAGGSGGGGVGGVDPSTTYFACYVPGSGTVYRIKAANTPVACTKASHVEFSWSPPTPPAPPITPGFSQVIQIASSLVTVQPNGFATAYAACPDGWTLTSGGHSIGDWFAGAGAPTVMSNRPEAGNKWMVSMSNFQPGAITMTFAAVAMCAK